MTSTSRMVLKWFHSLVILCLFLMGMSGQVSYLISISTVMVLITFSRKSPPRQELCGSF